MPTNWGSLEPEEALLGGIVRQACKDALHPTNSKLSTEAWHFLEVCAPTVAATLRKQDITKPQEASVPMAARHDLIQRVEALEERGLTVATDYHGQGLPKWLTPALGDCDVFMLNVKGVATDNTLCIVRLSRLEAIVVAAGVSTVSDTKKELEWTQ